MKAITFFVALIGATTLLAAAAPNEPSLKADDSGKTSAISYSNSADQGSVANADNIAAGRIVILKVRELDAAEARAVVVRRPPGGKYQNVILIESSTTAADLARAIASLMYSWRTQGRQVTRELRAEIAGAPPGAESRDSRRASRDLERLARAPEIELRGLGRGPAIQVTTVPVVEKSRRQK